MANDYIVLNNMRYATTGRKFAPRRKKSQQVKLGLTGKTLSQQFAFTDYRWRAAILVEITPTNPEYGSIEDLRAAYAEEYTPFIDQFGVDQGNVFMEGELPEEFDLALVDESAPFVVELQLRKRQV
jgi:hypothetical protein